MRAAQHPMNAARLAALRSYAVLDTPREADFDRIAAAAAALCGTKHAVVNLIDEHRQFFKAEIGFGVRELPLDDSICAHVILSGDYTEIPDTLADDRLTDNPLCLMDGGLRFYAGALLKSAEGLPIGTLCVLDDRPGTLDAVQRQVLSVLAEQVMAQLDLRHALREADLSRREADHRIKNALQSVAAISRVQARQVEGAEAREALRAVAGRIDAVAELNAELYRADRPDEVDLGTFLPSLVRLIERGAPAGVSFEVAAEPGLIEPRRAQALAVLLNELATNSVKHAFAEGSAGRITVRGARDAGGGPRYRFAYGDDGAGYDPAGVEAGLGSSIIASVLTQLDGAVEHEDGTGGHRLAVTFPTLDGTCVADGNR